MQLRKLGRTGLKVSEICLGTMTFGHQCDEATSFEILNRVREAGVNFIDTADVYPVPPTPETAGRTEEIVGNWLKGQRDRYVLVSKCRGRVGTEVNDEGLSRRHILRAVEASLRRLQTDRIEVYLAHSPDTGVQLEETLRTYEDLVRQGKVCHVGFSNHPAWKVALALGIGRANGWSRLEVVQPRYNLLFREIESELLPLCRDQEVGVMAYNPLAGGFLSRGYRLEEPPPAGTRFTLGGPTGKLYQARYWQRAQFEAVQALRDFFATRNRSLTQVAVAWVLAQPGISSAILGASRPEQLTETLAAVDVKLDAEELAACNQAWLRIPRSDVPPP
jgi:aryl-alcohol dehydrogenase-like predicted oxidoreductase